MNELKKNAPNLSEINKDQPFGVPDNYFDDFSARLHSRLEAEKTSLPKQKSRLIHFLKPAFGLAASFILIVMLVYWPLKTFLPGYLAKNNAPVAVEINEEDTYLAFMEKIDEDSFFALIVESDQEESFDDEELMNYLSSNFSEYEIFLETNY